MADKVNNKETIFFGNRTGKGKEALKVLYARFDFTKDKLEKIFDEIDRIYDSNKGKCFICDSEQK